MRKSFPHVWQCQPNLHLINDVTQTSNLSPTFKTNPVGRKTCKLSQVVKAPLHHSWRRAHPWLKDSEDNRNYSMTKSSSFKKTSLNRACIGRTWIETRILSTAAKNWKQSPKLQRQSNNLKTLSTLAGPWPIEHTGKYPYRTIKM